MPKIQLDRTSLMENGTRKAPGYKSRSIGKQVLQGEAIDRIEDACDTNVASKVDNRKWYAALVKNRSRLDKLHERLLKE
jgi:hypothetical protein